MADWRKIRTVSFYSLTGLSVLCFAVWYYFGEGGIRDANALRDSYESQRTAIAQKELHKQELNEYLTAIQRRDDAALELAARRFGLVGENEYLWKVVTEPVDSTNSN